MKKIFSFKKALHALLCASIIVSSTPVSAEEAVVSEATEAAASAEIATNQIEGWPQGPVITSEAAYVLEPSTNTVIYSKNADVELYPASSVKIMTALLAIEYTSLADVVTMTETGVSGVTDGGTSINTQVGEQFTMEQCLYAIILSSANDISLQVAEHIGESIDTFLILMNQKAADLGCTNTVFTNPTGLPDENQHTTAHDLALIMNAALSNETFRAISQTLTYTIPATNMTSTERVLTNTFTMIDPESDAYYIGCLGGKEGYTYESGSVLACMANRNDMDLVCTIMNGATDQTDDEAITVLDYAYNNFQFLDLGDDDFSIISGGNLLVPNGTTEDQLTITDTENSEGTLDRVYTYNGAVVGTAVAHIEENNDEVIASESEKNMQEALAYSSPKSVFPYIIAGAGCLAVIALFIYLIRRLFKK